MAIRIRMRWIECRKDLTVFLLVCAHHHPAISRPSLREIGRLDYSIWITISMDLALPLKSYSIMKIMTMIGFNGWSHFCNAYYLYLIKLTMKENGRHLFLQTTSSGFNIFSHLKVEIKPWWRGVKVGVFRTDWTCHGNFRQMGMSCLRAGKITRVPEGMNRVSIQAHATSPSGCTHP